MKELTVVQTVRLPDAIGSVIGVIYQDGYPAPYPYDVHARTGQDGWQRAGSVGYKSNAQMEKYILDDGGEWVILHDQSE